MLERESMSTIELMLTGHIEMEEFISLLTQDPILQNDVRNLIPQDAVDNPEHAFWKQISYESLKKNNYDFLAFLSWMCRFDGTISDNLNIFGAVRSAYSYYCPQLNVTGKYRDAFGLYLEVVKDCFDGPEVRLVVNQIIQDALRQKVKSKKKQQAKNAIVDQFHIADKKKPRWIQGPEWPAGSNSPMAFVSQKKQGSAVCYEFIDVDTGETRMIKQFY